MLKDEYPEDINGCGGGNTSTMSAVVINECMSELHHDPLYSQPGMMGYVIRKCSLANGYCEINITVCEDEHGNIKVSGIPTQRPNECGSTTTSEGIPVKCFSNCE